MIDIIVHLVGFMLLLLYSSIVHTMCVSLLHFWGRFYTSLSHFTLPFALHFIFDSLFGSMLLLFRVAFFSISALQCAQYVNVSRRVESSSSVIFGQF